MPKKDQSQETLSNIGRLAPRPIVHEMEESYLDYAMSVIVSRALPDARDGLKPVHRRVLHSMNQLGLKHSSKFLKSARIVGDVMGKYHPHGDSAIYESLVRMAQDFSLRYPLVRGQGNFGSIDGDSAAAMRYTESKMEKITEEMLTDIEKDTVDFRPNYDETRKEPSVLPSKIPQLLLNGTVGIAVGMATNIPPHNLNELMEAILHLMDHPKATVEDLLEFVKGPDFPTGGVIYGKKMLKQAYLTGRGSIPIRGVAEIEEGKNGKQRIRISQIPYQVNKSSLIERMAYLVQEKIVQGVSDIRDESSNREGMRIIIELKKDSYPQKILNQFFKQTPLQSSFGYNMIALADGLQPRLMNLQELLEIFIKHRREVTIRRITWERDRAKERAHILEGLKKALDNIDAVIKLIKSSKTKEIAKEGLMKKFKLTDIQADAILQMRLQTLAGLERKKIEDELKEKKNFIRDCEVLLGDQKKMDKNIKAELVEIQKIYGDERRTVIKANAIGEFSAKDTIPNAPMIVALTKQGYVKRLSPAQFRAQHRGGKGVKGMTTKDEDELMNMEYAMNHDELLCFTNTGRVFTIPVYELPQASRTAKGQNIINLLQLKPNEKISSILLQKFEGKKFLFMATKQGTVKRCELSEFDNIRKSGLIAQKMHDGDELKWVALTSGSDQLFLLSKKGKAIRFPEKDVRVMGRSAAGVRGIRLGKDDEVVAADPIAFPDLSHLLVVMENGLSKMTKTTEYRIQGRGGTGVKAANITVKTGNIVGGFVLTGEEKGDLICISKHGQTIRLQISDIPLRGRATQGVIIMRMKARDVVASISLVLEEEGEIDETKMQKAMEKARKEEVALQKAMKKEGIESDLLEEKIEVKNKKPALKKKAPAKKPAKKASSTKKKKKKR
ncbi:DNA gyrase subunit A [Candidatus Peribacteria bacterium]|jgi:DNA gyrase subunit A|nr:DNA gyrase subunit A [Candidatus Peribacteria bacterium]MBT4021670.1 DNA gyrase subunit A [Candidatus Peribacteria bacterium]MBT4240832.1 DNA gyrase subunit A [Candidatus Peribacteria bacterium]MBT4473786.1 DNA gyrase subunit A [Candidatus Peribacteria bacterium]